MLKLKNKIKLLESDIQFKRISRENDLSDLKNILSSPKFIMGSVASGLAVSILIWFSLTKIRKKQPKIQKESSISSKSITRSFFLLASTLIGFLRIIRNFL